MLRAGQVARRLTKSRSCRPQLGKRAQSPAHGSLGATSWIRSRDRGASANQPLTAVPAQASESKAAPACVAPGPPSYPPYAEGPKRSQIRRAILSPLQGIVMAKEEV